MAQAPDFATAGFAGPEFAILVLTPAGSADAALAIAACRAGHLGLFNAELPLPAGAIEAGLEALAGATAGGFGVKLADAGLALDLAGRFGPRGLSVVVLEAEAALAAPEAVAAIRAAGVRLLPEAIRWDDRLAGPLAAEGLVLKGHEAGGRVGEATAFILLQQAMAAGPAGPVFVRGGVGLQSAGALRAGGAAGVVLDDQCLMLRESALGPRIAPVLARMTGAETLLVEGAGGVQWRGMEQPGSRAGATLRTALAQGESEGRAAFGWDMAAGQIAPLGQAAAFAPDLAARFGSLGRLARALQDGSAAAVARAAAHPVWGAGQGVAAPHGTRWPLVQGPMTRVSDTAAFAQAVAEGGALPMVALALMRPEQADTLLAETAQRLAGRAWGVGLLGFAPSSLIRAQVEVALRHGPGFALIAGGRPDQARALEADGIPSYLHVPSPRLLAMFLEQGARRFVFEGRECGGHVGPMSSLVLWDAMVRTLLDSVTDPVQASEICVLFAGGIHDARSAAMVAALAAPLAERGIRVGMLMGTAYLFTEEAVSAGSIVQTFQKVLLDCQETVTLETGPGHASRAAMSPFAEEFAARRRALQADGTGGEDMREALEELTLGRLRIASKATERAGDVLKTVPARRQAQEGMYMIGQAAMLRDKVTTIAALHGAVCEGSAEMLGAARAAPVPATVAADRPADIAIVGLGAVLPGAETVAEYWENLLDSVDAITEIPRHRWDWRLYFDADPSAPDKIYSRWGGFLKDMPFDPMRYGIPPRSLPALDPLQLMTLEVARRTLEDAGLDGKDAPGLPRLRTSIILGASGGAGDVGAQYAVRSELPRFMGALDADAASRLPSWTEDSFAGILLNVAAGRAANRLDFGGVNFTVDAACASSLAAVYQAVLELETGRSDMVLAGGIDTVQGPFGYLCFSKTRALSPRGRSSSFEAGADGIVISEGLAMVALKRLADAERDGDKIYAVIKGVGGSSDGKAKSMTAPHPDGQIRALSRAYDMAGYSPATVGLFEAHGTGTVAGDISEMTTVTRLLTEAGAGPKASAIGSVKTLIGHTKAAAGIAGLIKAALACHHGVLPPHGRRGAPNARLNEPAIPLYLVDRPRPWVTVEGLPRRASVSAFGFGGTNFHVAMEEYGAKRAIPALAPSPRRRWGQELLVWRGRSRAALAAEVQALADRLAAGWEPALADLAFSLAEAARPGTLTAALTVSRSEPLAARVAALAAHLADAASPLPPGAAFSDAPLLANGGKLALIFPGQGSQYPEMMAEVAALFPELGDSLAEADAVLGFPLSRAILPAGAYDDAAQKAAAAALTATDVAQPALGAVEAGLWSLLSGMGLRPDMAAGHSYGEFVALHAAGVFSRADLFRVSRARGRFMVEAGAGGDLGSMAAARAPRDVLEALIEGIDGVCVANHNAPEQSILSGSREGLAEAARRAEAAGIPLRALQVGAAFHSPIVAPAQARLAGFIAGMDLHPARFAVYANKTAAAYPAGAVAICETLSSQLASPVEFVRQVEQMHADGARVFLSLGPKSAHTTMVRQILGAAPHRAITTDDEAGGLRGLLSGIGALLAEGAALDLARLFAGRGCTALPLTGPVPEAEALGRHMWLLNGSGARQVGSPPRPVLTLEEVEARKVMAAAQVAPPLAQPAFPEPAAVRPQIRPQPSRAAPRAPGLRSRPVREMLPMDTDNQDLSYPLQADEVLAEFQMTMARFLETQERVMLAYLGSGAGAAAAPRAMPRPARPMVARPAPVMAMPAPVAPVAAAAPAPVPASQPVAAPAPAPAPVVASAPIQVPTASAGLDRAGIAALLLDIVQDRTGYPADMLGMDQGIEADLGIDSIKRVEIIGALLKGLPGPQASAAQPMGETLNEQKTLGAIVEKLAAHLAGGAPAGAQGVVHGPFDLAAAGNAGEGARPPRYVMRAEAEALPAGPALPAGRYLVTEGRGGLAAALAGKIAAAGGTPVVLSAEAACEAEGPFAGLVHLAPTAAVPVALDGDWLAALEVEKSAYRVVRAHAEGLRQGRMVFASVMGGSFGRRGETGMLLAGGCTGLAKSLREEWPASRAKAIDLDPALTDEALAQVLMEELAAPYGRQEAGYPGGRRMVFRSVAADPADAARELPPGAVILATGGARGITAEILRPFAAAGCRLVLIGRTPLPGPEPEATAALTDTSALRQALMAEARATGEAVTPASIERALAGLMRDREIRANLADLQAAGATLDYLALDMADAAAVRAAVADIAARLGPVHGVIHGAGVIEDRRITDKTPDSWDRVVQPKVIGALALAAALDTAPPAFFALFASVAGRYGNSGQTDYAHANELLNRLAAQLARRWPACHPVAVNWGPWEGTRHGAGMVSDAVRAKFEAQEVTLVAPEGGAAAFFDEILRGPRDCTEVVLGAGPWEKHEAERAGMPEAPRSRWPLLPGAQQAPAAKGGTAIRRRLDVGADPWLGEHRIGAVPVLPLAVAAEMCAEAAAEIWSDWTVTGLADLRLLNGLRLEGDAPCEIDLVAQGSEHADATGFAARVELRETGNLPRAHYRASVRMVPSALQATDPEALALAQDILAHPVACSPVPAGRAYREMLFHGPSYQLLKVLEGLDAGGARAEVRPSRAADFGGGAWLFDPGLLDAAAQLAWVWSIHARGQPALPNAIGRATKLGTGAARRMVMRLHPGLGPAEVRADVAIADAAGQPLLLLEALEATSDAGLARFCGWGGEILADIALPKQEAAE
ncbi:SDR family NAD(P)-dependent oxidoreductase [Frigidibacter albus]|uniref:SDR family NAD(P)-dependent oxidoreductase n=1 Tax=Frigidibacter albus TaxID=1465486 RepID=A0A6L8VI95_9RHOB|nr:type I polyketide synthase [Frigidibacter albus]MZQ90107.1 SDR family NAD(P)-dependent oxidoreductase [Frigidibacter albus]NBE32015.1 SDR family NAD(P)-dependent oxidoreductase [Frigidibacter albus]GGH57359.1 hypothetical protein GCM10011341_26680 [Frigidibacter albus]